MICERNSHQLPFVPAPPPPLGTWPATQACALTGNRTGDPLLLRPALNPLSHISQGEAQYIFDILYFINSWLINQKSSVQHQNIKCLWLGVKFTTICDQTYKIESHKGQNYSDHNFELRFFLQFQKNPHRGHIIDLREKGGKREKEVKREKH